MSVSVKSHGEDLSLKFFGDPIGNNEYWVGAYIVKTDRRWKDPLNGKVYDAVVFKYLTRDTSPKDVEKIFKERRFTMIRSNTDNLCSHILADPKWHGTIINKEVVVLFEDDNHGQRADWDIGCSTYTPHDFYKKEKFYRTEFGLGEPSKVINLFNFVFRIPTTSKS
ncbi:MAG: hypothetical protein ACSNEK_00205 [Parachlamydiaceae bacterium]